MPAVIDLTGSSDEPDTRPELNSPKKRKKKGSKSNVTGKKSRQASPTRRSVSPQPFYVDLTPASLPPSAQFLPSQSSLKPQELLLPPHVSVFDDNTAVIIPETEHDTDEEYIEYLDFDDRKNFTRYFDDEPGENPKTTKVVCRSCGAEGEHKTIACPVRICLTCGARNEHSTFSCPVGKTCFGCGMRGHLKQDCPNPQYGRSLHRSDECKRCGSMVHSKSECPMVWRRYEYSCPEERDSTLSSRQSKTYLRLGEGGEGFIAEDEWCYNCGSSGHWGDDCEDLPHIEDMPSEPSAFSTHNVSSGPFSSQKKKSAPKRSRSSKQTHPWYEKIPDKVGKGGRLKDMEKLKRQEMSLADDPDDWFGSAGKRPNKEPRRKGKISFGRLAEKPSLLSRISGASPASENHVERSHSRGPRYMGGYTR